MIQVAARVGHMKPKAFIMENVPALAAKKHRPYLLQLLKLSSTKSIEACKVSQFKSISHPRMNKSKQYVIRLKA